MSPSVKDKDEIAQKVCWPKYNKYDNPTDHLGVSAKLQCDVHWQNYIKTFWLPV